MTVFRHKKNNRLYKLYLVTPRAWLGRWHESEDLFTGEIRKLNYSSWKEKDFEETGYQR